MTQYKKSNLIEWGENHRLFVKDDDRARFLAYQKAFYFTTKLNGQIVKRAF